MHNIDHGDLVEQRRGGVDTLRVMVATLGAHHHSGAIHIQSIDGGQKGWLVVRLGQPVMASLDDESGLDALLSIEQLGLQSTCDLMLHELTVAQIRTLIQQHPEAILNLSSTDKAVDGAWWANTALPITGWRRTSSIEDLADLELRTDTRPRTKQTPRQKERLLSPGGVYLHDSPDPHPMLHLGVELGGRGMPLLGLFSLPYAQTDITRQLPSPSCYGLFRSIGDLTTLSTTDEMVEVLNQFLWESDRSVVVLNGLDRIGNALGDEAMMAFYRLVTDHVQMGDHALLCTTDLSVFDTMTQHKLRGEAELLSHRDIDGWLHDSDLLLDHPLLVPDEDDELMWMEAHLDHHARETGFGHGTGHIDMVGGSVEVDNDTRHSATTALKGLVDDWPDSEPMKPSSAPQSAPQHPPIGTTPWQVRSDQEIRPTQPPMEGVRSNAEYAPVAPSQRSPRRPRATFVKPTAPKGPRRPQRMKARKASPRLPDIEHRPTTAFSNQSSSDDAAFEAIRGRRSPFNRQGLADVEERMNRKIEAIKPLPSAAQRELRDALRNEKTVVTPHPSTGQRKTWPLPSNEDAMLKGRRVPSGITPERRSRESSNRQQHHDDLDALHQEWVSRKEQTQFRSTALYDETGRPLHRFGVDRT